MQDPPFKDECPFLSYVSLDIVAADPGYAERQLTKPLDPVSSVPYDIPAATYSLLVLSKATRSSGLCSCNLLFFWLWVTYPAEASLAPLNASTISALLSWTCIPPLFPHRLIAGGVRNGLTVYSRRVCFSFLLFPYPRKSFFFPSTLYRDQLYQRRVRDRWLEREGIACGVSERHYPVGGPQFSSIDE